ncbi:lysylphosphatidylglycerol synthase transmembrane domain-containing protein [Planctomycetota bacterium]
MTQQTDGALCEGGPKAPKLWGWHTWLSMIITVVILVVLAMMIDLREVWQHITACNKLYVLLGGLAHYATYPVRGLRWRRCLFHLPLQAGRAKFGLLVFFYNFVDNVVPAKLGDVYGAHLARINCGVRRSAALGSMVFLRTVDAWIVLLLAAVSSWVLFAAKLPPSVMWALLGGIALALVATSILLTFFMLKKRLPAWVPERLQEMIHAFHTGMWPRTQEFVPIALLSVFIWTLEILWCYFIALAFGVELGFAQVIFLTMIPLLATAFPLTPSGVGVVDATLFLCLNGLLGVAAPVAASLTVANRFIDHWLHIGLGMIVWAMRGVFGLNTWREVPLDSETPEDTQEKETTPEPLVCKEVVHGH